MSMPESQNEERSAARMKVVICPYCGETQPAGERCRVCLGLFEPLSRQATHNAMGPWFIRNPGNPFQPGMSYETLVKMVDRGQINRYTIVRGPTTKQFWTVARHTPGVAHLLGYCHSCDTPVNKKELGCAKCGAPFGAYLERNYLGLPEIKPLPWEAETPDATDQWGAHFGTPRPQATGLSSFGTDEELSGGASRMAATTVLPPPALNGGAHAGTSAPAPARPAPALASVLEADQSHLAARQRSLERRLAHQQRTIRWLIIIAAAAVVAALLFALGIFESEADQGEHSNPASGSDSAPLQEATTGRPTDDDQEALDNQGRPGDEQAQRGEEPAPPSSEGGAVEADQRAAQPGDAGAVLDSPGPADPFHLEFTRAEGLIAQSRDESANIDDRIARLTEAIAILKQIELAAPPESRPANLTDLIAAQERELKRLEVKRWLT
jgi:hypothetical protein